MVGVDVVCYSRFDISALLRFLQHLNCLFVARFLGEKIEMEGVLEQVKFEEKRRSRNMQVCHKLLHNKD